MAAFPCRPLGDDLEAIETLQDFFGYVLAPDTSLQKALLVVGPTRSGKGTLARVLQAVIGPDSVAAPTLASLASNFGLAPLIGKSVAIISDARLGGRADQAAIAERILSISGEDALTVDRKFLPAWTGKLSTRFIAVDERTAASSRRQRRTGQALHRPGAAEQLSRARGPGPHPQAARRVAGHPELGHDGYSGCATAATSSSPRAPARLLRTWRRLVRRSRRFVKERCEIGPLHACEVDRLYSAWRIWCEDQGRKEPGTKQSFGRDLKAAFPSLKVARPRTADGRERIYEGIALKPVVRTGPRT